MMDKVITNKLFEELRHRNGRLLIPHLWLIFIAIFLFRNFHEKNLWSFFPYVMIVVSLLARQGIMRWRFEKFRSEKSLVYWLYLVFVFMTGLGWGWLFWGVEKEFGFFSVEALVCLGIIIFLISGGITAFSSSLKVTVTFFMALMIIPAYVTLTEDSGVRLLGMLLVGNGLYQIYHAWIANKYLKENIRKELLALQQKDILQDYIDALPGIVGLIDKNATYVMVNNYLDGKIKEKILGTKVGATLSNNPVSNLILDFMKVPDTHWVHEVHAHDLAGENWYMVNLKKVSSPQEGVIAAILPINELVKARNDLKIQEARSQYAAKLASLGEFSAGIAHEVSNPLTIIEGSLNQLKDTLVQNPQDVGKLQVITDKVLDTTQRIGKIIKGLRILSKDADEEPFKNVNFHSIVGPAQEITKAKLGEHRIELRIKDEMDDMELFGNEIQLGQVVMNLISNSIDAVKELDERWIEIQYRPSYEWSDIIVIDSGKGVPDSIRDKIMDPFFTTKDSLQGTGLGLSISKSIVERHYGSLALLPKEKNTTFRIRLPRMNQWRGSRKRPLL